MLQDLFLEHNKFEIPMPVSAEVPHKKRYLLKRS